MKTRKVIGLLVVLIAVLAFSGIASAAEYTVVKGDTFWGMAVKFAQGRGHLYPMIMADNNFTRDPKNLRVGERIKIREFEKDVVYLINHNNSPYRAEGVKGNEKVLEAINKTPCMENVKEVLGDMIKNTDPSDYLLKRVERFNCMTDKKGVHCDSPGGYEIAGKEEIYPSVIWWAEIDNNKYDVVVKRDCGNVYPRCEKLPAPPEEKRVLPVVPPENIEKKEEKKEEPATQYQEKKPEKIVALEAKRVLEYEPIAGAYVWKNNLAEGWGGYADGKIWLRKTTLQGYANGWSPGIGLYGFYSEGDSRKSSYSWIEKGIGPELGLKYGANDKKGRFYQFQVVSRLVWEQTRGRNDEGYWMRQNTTKLGLYGEATKNFSEKLTAGITAEGWMALDKSITSSWSGDQPQSRTMFAVNLFTQHKIDDNWKIRLRIAESYQGWDKIWPTTLGAELRYKETVMFGPWYSFFPFGINEKIYNPYGASDLSVAGLAVRVELGNYVRERYAKYNSSTVKSLPKVEFVKASTEVQ